MQHHFPANPRISVRLSVSWLSVCLSSHGRPPPAARGEYLEHTRSAYEVCTDSGRNDFINRSHAISVFPPYPGRWLRQGGPKRERGKEEAPNRRDEKWAGGEKRKEMAAHVVDCEALIGAFQRRLSLACVGVRLVLPSFVSTFPIPIQQQQQHHRKIIIVAGKVCLHSGPYIVQRYESIR